MLRCEGCVRPLPDLACLQMAVKNAYGVKAVSDEEAESMRSYSPLCVSMIEACQEISQVCT